MLAVAVSLLFGLAAFAALAVLASSLIAGQRRVGAILAELAEIDRRARVTRPQPVRLQPQPVLVPLLAAA